MNYEIEVTVRGPQFERETSYGPRTDRDVYAHVQVPVAPTTAWDVVKYAIQEATSAPAVDRS